MVKDGLLMIPAEVLDEAELSPRAFLFYAIILRSEHAFIAYEDFRILSGVKSDTTISKTLKELASKGLIKIEQGDSFESPNSYFCLGQESWKFSIGASHEVPLIAKGHLCLVSSGS